MLYVKWEKHIVGGKIKAISLKTLILISSTLCLVLAFVVPPVAVAGNDYNTSLKIEFNGSSTSRNMIERVRIYVEREEPEDFCIFLLGNLDAPVSAQIDIPLAQPECPDPDDPASSYIQNIIYVEFKLNPINNLGSYEKVTFKLKFPYSFILNWNKDIELNVKLAKAKNYEIQFPANRKMPVWTGARPTIDFAKSATQLSFFPIQDDCVYQWSRYTNRWPQAVEYFRLTECERDKFPIGPIKSIQLQTKKVKLLRTSTYGCPSWNFDGYYKMVQAGWKAKIGYETAGQFAINRIFAIFEPNTWSLPQPFSYPCAFLPRPLIYKFPDNAEIIRQNAVSITAFKGSYNVLVGLKLRDDYFAFPAMGKTSLGKKSIAVVHDFDCIHKYWAIGDTPWDGIYTWAENENWGRNWC